MQSDDDLMRQCADGDAGAFELVYARHAESVRRKVSRIVRDAVVADDLIQETFLRVWTHGKQWAGRGSVAAWICRIATNAALNHLRSASLKREEPLYHRRPGGEEDACCDAPEWLADAAVLGPAALLQIAERRQRMTDLIERLPEEKREVVRMVRELDMDLREAAAALGIPVGTVKSRLHYATAWLAREWNTFRNE